MNNHNPDHKSSNNDSIINSPELGKTKKISFFKSCLLMMILVLSIIYLRWGYFNISSSSYTYKFNGQNIYSIKYSNKYHRGFISGNELRIWNRMPPNPSCFLPDSFCSGTVFLSLRLTPIQSKSYNSVLEKYNGNVNAYDRIKDMSPTIFKGKDAYSIPGGVVIFEKDYMLEIEPTKESEAGLNAWDPDLISNLVLY